MRSRVIRGAIVALVAVQVLGVVTPSGAAGLRTVVVAEDAAGDFGGGDPWAGPGKDQGGDLIAASISQKGKDLLVFGIQLESVASNASAISYGWSFGVLGKDGSVTEWSLGGGFCADPVGCQPGQPAFSVAECTSQQIGVLVMTNCAGAQKLSSEIDADRKTIWIEVPIELIGAEKRSEIASNQPIQAFLVGGSVNGQGPPMDDMAVTKSFVVK